MAITVTVPLTDINYTRRVSTILKLCQGASDDPMEENGPFFWDDSTSVDEGKATVHKNFNIVMRSDVTNIQPREVCPTEILYVEGIPKKGDRLPEDNRYVFTGNATIEHLEENSRHWVYKCEYSLASLNTSISYGRKTKRYPWQNGPTNVTIDYPEEVVSFQFSRNEKNERIKDGRAVNPPRNTAGDILDAQTKRILFQLTFSYCVQKSQFDRDLCQSLQNSVNADDIKICGFKFEAGTAMITSLKPVYHNEVIDSDDDSAKQWWEIGVTIQQDNTGDGFAQRFLNIGDRARFYSQYTVNTLNGSAVPSASSTLLGHSEPIYYWRTWGSNGQIDSTSRIQFGNAALLVFVQQIYARQFPDMQFAYEKGTQIPLNANGTIDTDALDAKSSSYGKYLTVVFRDYAVKSWKGLHMPQNIDGNENTDYNNFYTYDSSSVPMTV